jgi:hypothetical protein
MLMVRSFVLTALLFVGGVAHATVILQVDVSNPSAVVFIPTAADAQTTLSNIPSTAGIVLSDFFSGNEAFVDTTLDSGSLSVLNNAVGSSSSSISQIFVSNFLSLTTDDINIFGGAGDGFGMYFLDDQQALSGLASHNLGAFTGFPTLGTIGTVFAGDPNNNDIIGQYQVVPEPSTAALMALGLVGLAARRRSR